MMEEDWLRGRDVPVLSSVCFLLRRRNPAIIFSDWLKPNSLDYNFLFAFVPSASGVLHKSSLYYSPYECPFVEIILKVQLFVLLQLQGMKGTSTTCSSKKPANDS